MTTDENNLISSITEVKEISLGKFWAIILNDKVFETITMKVPDKADFDKYRTSAISCLELLSNVRTGELVERAGERIFILRRMYWSNNKPATNDSNS